MFRGYGQKVRTILFVGMVLTYIMGLGTLCGVFCVIMMFAIGIVD